MGALQNIPAAPCRSGAPWFVDGVKGGEGPPATKELRTMTQYLISVWGSEQDLYEATAEAMEQAYAQVEQFNTRLQESGVWVFAGGLEAPSTATMVDATRGDAVVTDGPFLETKEQLGGFWVVEAPDLDAALALPRRLRRLHVPCGGPPVPV
jgi:hypothetical protein